jgi:hypothetical protein
LLSSLRQRALSRAAATGRRRLAKRAAKRIRLARRRPDTGLHIGWTIGSGPGNALLRDAADRYEKDKSQGDASFQHGELHRCSPKTAPRRLLGAIPLFGYSAHVSEAGKLSLGQSAT